MPFRKPRALPLLVSSVFLVMGVAYGLAAPSGSSSKRSAARLPEVPLRSELRLSAEPLTQERFWQLEPRELNPHRRFWFLERAVSLDGLRAVQDPKAPGRYRIEAHGIQSTSLLHLRAEGQWYRPFTDFRCEPEPNAWFATRAGSEVAGRAAEAAWREALDSKRLRLAVELERIGAESEAEALAAANAIFRRWLADAESEWWVKGRNQACQAEWRSYLVEAHKIGQCKPGQKDKEPPLTPTWSALMPRPSETPSRTVIARAPAKRWGGLYSIRLSVVFGDKTLNGQFLVDSGSAVSIVSPVWLKAQGINPALVEKPGSGVQRVTWSGGSGLARKAQAFRTSIADIWLPLSEFLLMETDLFGPPDFGGSCCDGILGADLLRHYAVEFTPGPPASIALQERGGYSEGKDAPWVEVASLPSGEPVASSCVMESQDRMAIAGARFDTGSEAAVDIHRPWEARARRAKGPWRLSCGALTIAEPVPVSYPESRIGGESNPLSVRIPGFNVGMEVLGRGKVTFDLANGRLWFDPAALKKPIPANRSGLELKFRYDEAEGERYLQVVRIKPGSPAEKSLGKAGLKAGMRILEMDGDGLSSLNPWEVEQRLSGERGKTVAIKWRVKGKVEKIAPLELIDPEAAPASE